YAGLSGSVKEHACIRKGLCRNGKHILVTPVAAAAHILILLLALPASHHICSQAVDQPHQRNHSGGFLHRLHLRLEQDDGIFQGVQFQGFLSLQTAQNQGGRLDDGFSVVGVVDKCHVHSSISLSILIWFMDQGITPLVLVGGGQVKHTQLPIPCRVV